MPDNLRERLIAAVQRADPDSEAAFFSPDDMRWAETTIDDDVPTVYINHAKFRGAGAEGYEDKMMLGEALHVLKRVDPERYERLYQAAMSDQDYQRWMRDSYDHSRAEYGEQRSLDDWHRDSRFDQVIGGYLFAGDESIPTMRNWTRDLPYGKALTAELEALRQELGIE